MNIFKKVVLLSFTSVIVGAALHAQSLSGMLVKKHRNDCVQYFRNVKDTSKALLKSVAITRYLADDSLMSNKRFGGKTMRTFDEIGQETFVMNVDSNMTVIDSERTVYNGKHDMVRDSKYELDDSTHRMKATKEEFITYNSAGKLLVDSTIENNKYNAYYSGKKTEGVTMVIHYIYNNEGDAEKMLLVSNRNMLMGGMNDSKAEWDTIPVFLKYDNKHRVTYTAVDVYGIPSKQYDTYDDSGRSVFSAKVEFTDSTTESRAFDKKGRTLWEKDSKNGTITYNERLTIDKNGNSIDTIERYTPARGMQCANNEVEVMISDTAGNTLSITTLSQKDSKPFVHSVKHIYTFNKKGSILMDSVITSDQGHLYTELSENVTETTYDKNNDPVLEITRGGNGYNSNSRATWTYNARHNILEVKRYNSCVADIPTSSYIKVYYPDNETVKQSTSVSGYYTTVEYYAIDGLETKEDNIGGYSRYSARRYNETVYEYKK